MRRPRTASAAHPTNMRVLVGIVFATGIAVMLLAGCGSGSPASGQKPPSRGSVDPAGATVTPGSYDEVFDTISTIFENRDAVYGLGRGLEAFAEADDAAPAAPSPNIASDVAQEAGGGYSGTNVQVQGIDEGDIVKTDGKSIYMVSGAEVVIVRADGAQTEEVARISVDEAMNTQEGPVDSPPFIYPRDLYVSGNILVVLYEYNIQEPSNGQPGAPADSPDRAFADKASDGSYDIEPVFYRSVTEVARYDISDPHSPRFLGTLGQDGYYTSSRLQNGILYLVSNHFVFDPAQLAREVPSTYVPRFYTGSDYDIMAVEDISILPDYDTTAYSVITSFDVARGGRIGQQSVLGASHMLYMSQDNLYLANGLFDKAELNSYQDGSFTVTEYQEGYMTRIAKFSLDEGAIAFLADTLVPGAALNQFALDEHAGHLRIVTTLDTYRYRVLNDGTSELTDYQSYESEPSTNALFVLDGNLQVSGSIEGLAEDERVYSVRFDGPVGYFVTFRQVDPLFAVDLSDPANPAVKGTLKIPGFSSYLHIYAENRLFGLGMAADDEGRAQGLKMSMFDTSDPYNISEKHLLGLEWAYSDALYNHRALVIAPEKNLIGFPVENGYAVYGYSEEGGFSLRQSLEPADGSFFYNMRGLYAGDYFYLCSPESISVYTLDDLVFVVRVPIEVAEMAIPIMPLLE